MVVPKEREFFRERIGSVMHPMQPPRLQIAHRAGVVRGLAQQRFGVLKIRRFLLRRE